MRVAREYCSDYAKRCNVDGSTNESRGCVCTRKRGHIGPHIAHAAGVELVRWNRTLEEQIKRAKERRRKLMPHKADRCFLCKERYDGHGKGKDKNGKTCKNFEFTVASARSDKDILFAAPFQSESSAKVYSVQAWRQGDYSCNCTGWRNYRTCKHIEQVAANPERYKGKAAAVINSGAGSVVGTVDALSAKMAAAEAAAKRGDGIELAKLQAEIDMQREMLGAAADSLGDRFQRMQTNIREHVYGGTDLATKDGIKGPKMKAKDAQPAPSVIVNPDDPFAD